VQVQAQYGVNRTCVECGDTPYGGGMRCWRCFKRRVDEGRLQHESSSPPSVSTYGKGCRCRPCREVAAETRTSQRRRAAGKAA
jgi:hypothetical protein